MAFSTNAAGPSLQSFSKTEAIAGSVVAIGAILCALLVGIGEGRVHARRQFKTKPASIRLRRKSSDLVRAREVFGSRGEDKISGQSRRAPFDQRKPQPRAAGRAPF